LILLAGAIAAKLGGGRFAQLLAGWAADPTPKRMIQLGVLLAPALLLTPLRRRLLTRGPYLGGGRPHQRAAAALLGSLRLGGAGGRGAAGAYHYY